MSRKLLTNVVVNLVNRYAASQEYGVSLVNIPDFDYSDFVSRLSNKKSIEIFFLGFSGDSAQKLTNTLPAIDHVKYSFSVEDAETSRNTGDESVFRILIIKRAELEKLSSLRWFTEIGLEKVYTQSCDYVKRELKNTNTVIESLIQALRCKPIRSILGFERVLDYLELLMEANTDALPETVRENYYRLGLLADKKIVSKNPDKDEIVSRIKRNHAIIERISNLEQAERQSITNYYAKASVNRDIPRLILSYYKTKNIDLLQKMDLEDVESCLKAVKEKPAAPSKSNKMPVIKPTALAAQLVFAGNTDKINDILDQIEQGVDDGKYEILDVAGTPHMLIAGTTGSGKTIFLQSMLVSLLHQFSADDMELLIIDPKQTDFIFFEGLPHLYGGKVVIDAEEALEMLQRINTVDKEERTASLRACRSKDIDSYNQKNPDKKMKRLVVMIDEYSDLIQAAEMNGTRKDFEKNLLMLLQRVRNLGIHLIIATQRPSAQIVTGALKAVIPFRVSFRLPSHTDSQTILDRPGAENLLGKGDMLMVTESDTKRMQGLFVSEAELEKFIETKIKK